MLLDQIQSDLNSALKNREREKLETLRFLIGAIKNLGIEKYLPGSQGPPAGGLTDEDVLSVLSKQVKTHKESIEMFQKGNRQDLVDREQTQLIILQSYLPAQMSEEDVRLQLSKLVSENSGKDFGTMMKMAMVELKGKVDGNTVSKILRELLK